MTNEETGTYICCHPVEGGIERVSYVPKQRRFETPILMQHTPPIWQPPSKLKTPLLVIAGERDTAIRVESERCSAARYGAPLVVVPEASHNMMMEHNLAETARTIQERLVGVGIR